MEMDQTNAQIFARRTLMEGLRSLSYAELEKFKKLHGKPGMSLNQVVDLMPGSKLDAAIELMQRTRARRGG